MSDCIFCSIVKGDISAEKIYEDEFVVAFNDINPVAPTHVLVIPKEHIDSTNDINESNKDIISDIFIAINKITKSEGIDSEGYRIVNNCGEYGGQTVNHIHFHIIGGRNMTWPPG